jgi:hypothetical protein
VGVVLGELGEGAVTVAEGGRLGTMADAPADA